MKRRIFSFAFVNCFIDGLLVKVRDSEKEWVAEGVFWCGNAVRNGEYDKVYLKGGMYGERR